MEAVAVDLARREHPHADLLRAAGDCAEQPLAVLGRDLLRVVQERQRTDAMATQRLVVEEDAGDDERPG